MDFVLIFIILVIVIIIGYVLSRPFLRTEEVQANPAGVRDDAERSQQIHPSPEENIAHIQNNTHADHRDTKPENKNAKSASSMCSKCGHLVEPNDKFCPYCGHRLQS